jgi:polar amino acid transport system substrate-binding protein
MTKPPLLLCALTIALAVLAGAFAQDQTPIPTLAVPTLVAIAGDSAAPIDFAGNSAVSDIIGRGLLRVGVLYNEPPYSQFTSQGDLRGYDIDLLRLIAELWDAEIEFVQVTRENALAKLNRADVDLVASAFVHYRDLHDQLAFSQTYLMGKQVMLVRAGDPYNAPIELISELIGYVIGTRSEKALSLWSASLDNRLSLQRYWNLDLALAAVDRGEIKGLVAEEQALLRLTAEYSDRFRILDEAVVREPRAFAIRRQDIALRHLLSHSIQLLAEAGSLQGLNQDYFPESDSPAFAVTLWDGVGESVDPARYAGEASFPARHIVPRLSSAGVLRVGGMEGGAQASSAGQEQLAALNAALVREFANRWGVTVEVVSSTAEEAADLLAKGEIDIIAGLKPDWRQVPSMDFSAPYLLHGDRLMAPASSQIRGFNDLRGRIIGVIIGDDGAQDRAQAWADSINASVRFFRTTEAGADNTLLDFNNAHAIYADSLLLVAHLQANPNALRLTERWYSRSYYAFGLPYNDLDFRLLVDYTFQELVRDGTLQRLSAGLLLSEEMPDFEITPGGAAYAGFSLAAS